MIASWRSNIVCDLNQVSAKWTSRADIEERCQIKNSSFGAEETLLALYFVFWIVIEFGRPLFGNLLTRPCDF